MESSRETAVVAVKKEQKATALVAELTAMIKEQKTRISELNRSKQETVASLKVSSYIYIIIILHVHVSNYNVHLWSAQCVYIHVHVHV